MRRARADSWAGTGRRPPNRGRNDRQTCSPDSHRLVIHPDRHRLRDGVIGVIYLDVEIARREVLDPGAEIILGGDEESRNRFERVDIDPERARSAYGERSEEHTSELQSPC